MEITINARENDPDIAILSYFKLFRGTLGHLAE